MRTDKNLTWGGQPYEAPTVTSLDILSEGLLCQSGFNFTEGGAGKYEDGDIFDNGEY